VKNLKDRLARLERETVARVPTTQCDSCRDWPSVCWCTVDEASGTETWGTERPRECLRCGWTAHVVMLHILQDWRSVTRKPGQQ